MHFEESKSSACGTFNHSAHFQSRRACRFYGSSLLLIYEGDEKEPPKTDVRMIDFAHVYPITDGGIDAGYMHGIDTLVKNLSALQNERSQN